MDRRGWLHHYFFLIQLCLWCSFTVGRIESEEAESASVVGEVLCEIQTLDISFDVALDDVGSRRRTTHITSSTSAGHDECIVCQTSSLGNVQQKFRINTPNTSIFRNGDIVRLYGTVGLDHTNARLVTINTTQWEIVTPSATHLHIRNLRSSGAKLALVVRVTYQGVDPSLSASQLQGRIFGRGPDRVTNSLRSQLEACSASEYRIRVPPKHSEIVGGVMEVTITKSVAGNEDSVLVLENLVVAQVTRRLTSRRVDQPYAAWFARLSHIMIVLPHHVDIRFDDNPRYIAYGYVGGTVSVFRNMWGGVLSALQHETGHNMGLAHAGRDGNVYNDTSGGMGYVVDRINGPRQCYNAQKMYMRQWYPTRHLFLQDLPYAGWLAFFGHTDVSAETEPAIISLWVPGSQRLFLQYNLARGLNADTRLGRNAVTIVRDEGKLGDTTEELQSWWVGAMSQEKGYARTVRYPISTSRVKGDLIFKVCDTVAGPPAKVHVSIYFTGYSSVHPSTVCAQPLLPYCDDDMYATFKVDEKERNCGWLMRQKLQHEQRQGTTPLNAIWQEICSDPQHGAYQSCRETCGVCHDDCDDSAKGRFWVDSQLGWKTCEWLSSRRAWQEQLCIVGHDAFRMCPESCDRCD